MHQWVPNRIRMFPAFDPWLTSSVAADVAMAASASADALATRFGSDLSGLDEQARERLETLNGIHSNAAGFRRWLSSREAGSSPVF